MYNAGETAVLRYSRSYSGPWSGDQFLNSFQAHLRTQTESTLPSYATGVRQWGREIQGLVDQHHGDGRIPGVSPYCSDE
jgi:hypothetical protein